MEKAENFIEEMEQIADIDIDEMYRLIDDLIDNFKQLKKLDVDYRELEAQEGLFGQEDKLHKTLKKRKEIIEKSLLLLTGEEKIENKIRKITEHLEKNLEATEKAIEKIT